MSDELKEWVQAQRALAQALGLSLEDWLNALDAAGRHRPGVTAAVIGASIARKRGMPDLTQIDGPALAAKARALIDPAPPRTDHPVLAEAIRRAGGLSEGQGAQRLTRAPVRRPDRAAPSDAPSATEATADAPGTTGRPAPRATGGPAPRATGGPAPREPK